MKWSPIWAKNAEGEWNEQEELPIRIQLTCSVCGNKSETRCTQGMPRTQVSRYALMHVHDPEMKRWLENSK